MPPFLSYFIQALAVRALVLHGEQLYRLPLGRRVRLHPHGALHRPLHRNRLPAQAKNVKGARATTDGMHCMIFSYSALLY